MLAAHAKPAGACTLPALETPTDSILAIGNINGLGIVGTQVLALESVFPALRLNAAAVHRPLRLPVVLY
jgi:hypothetical protein